MMFEVYYTTRWFKDIKFCGNFSSLELASDHVNYLQKKLPNGNKIRFTIAG